MLERERGSVTAVVSCALLRLIMHALVSNTGGFLVSKIVLITSMLMSNVPT